MTGIFTSSEMNATPSSAITTVPWNSKFPNVQYEKRSPAYRHLRPSGAAHTSSSPALPRFDIFRLLMHRSNGEIGVCHEYAGASAHVQPESYSAQIHGGQTPPEHLLDLELSVGIAARSRRYGKSILDNDRSPERSMAGLRDAGVQCGAIPPGDRWYAGAF